MFTTKDLILLDYFSIVSATLALYELKSKNTGHLWKLIKVGNMYELQHKHKEKDKYHHQTDVGNLYDGILYIISHDEYQLHGRKTCNISKDRTKESLFWKLIDIYGLYA